MFSRKYKKSFLIVLLMSFFGGLVFADVDEAVNPTRSLQLQQSLRNMNSASVRDKANKKPSSVKKETKQEQKKQSQQEAEPVSAAEPNETDVSYEPLDPFTKLQRNGQQELRAWIHSKNTERIGLVNSVQSQFSSELKYIRKLAAQEGAPKTVNAIDKIMAERKARMDKVVQRIREVRLQQDSQNQSQSGLLNQPRGRRTNEYTRGIRGRNPRSQTQQGQNSRFNRQTGATNRVQRNQQNPRYKRALQKQRPQQKDTDKPKKKRRQSSFEEVFKQAMQKDR